MASSFVVNVEESSEPQQLISPRNLRRTLSSNSSSCGHDSSLSPPPKCVCAPATHARSFKCRLHRVNSDGHSSCPNPPPPTPPPPPPTAPMPQQQPTVINSATRTVEAL